MCLRPITITNNTRRFVSGLARPTLTVPCGHCKECLKRKEDDMFVRAFFEYKRILDAGGQVWFPTLTFNDEHLPMWHDNENNFHCQVCDPILIKRFRDHFRMELVRSGYPIEDIRFEFVTEYGSDKGRLHHHALIFVPFVVPESTMVECLEKAWAYKLEPVKVPHVITKGKNKGKTVYRYQKDSNGKIVKVKVPKNGYVMWSNEYPKTLQHERGIQYVQKYINKPQAWIDRYGINEYEAKLKDNVRFWSFAKVFKDFVHDLRRELKRLDASLEYTWMRNSLLSHQDLFSSNEYHKRLALYLESMCEMKYSRFYDASRQSSDYLSAQLDAACDKLRAWRRVSPKHFKSTFFGADGIDLCFKNADGSWNIDALVDGKINLSEFNATDVVSQNHSDSFLYNMPFYYSKRIFENRDEYGLTIKNDLYDKVFDMRFKESQKRQIKALIPYFDVSGLSAHLAPLNLPESKIKEIVSQIDALMAERPVSDLVLYNSCYRGLFAEGGSQWLRDLIEPVSGVPLPLESQQELVRSKALDYLYEQHHKELFVEPTPERFKNRSLKSIKGYEWSNFECFVGFDEVLDLIFDYESRLDAACDDAWFIDERRKIEVMKYFPKNKYCLTKFD